MAHTLHPQQRQVWRSRSLSKHRQECFRSVLQTCKHLFLPFDFALSKERRDLREESGSGFGRVCDDETFEADAPLEHVAHTLQDENQKTKAKV
jgi:hypothetical protein